MGSNHSGRFTTGLIGRDIGASRSPWLHEREADAQGFRLVYALHDFSLRGWDESDLPRVLDAAKALGVAGLNVTHPYKQAIVPLLDDLSDGARRVGAVNTVKFEGARAIGHNTDVTGFAESLRVGLPEAALGHVLQAGAGGAGFATAHALLDVGVERLSIADTDPARAASLVAKLETTFGAGRASVAPDAVAALGDADGFVNATPVGMAAYPGIPVPPDALRRELWVADIVYFPLETLLLAEARGRGCRTLDGSGMAVRQAAAAFDIFTGATADRDRMLDSFKAFVAGDGLQGGRREAA
jgi:shikimate dehydrogenase